MLLHCCVDTECRNHASMVLPRDMPNPSKAPAHEGLPSQAQYNLQCNYIKFLEMYYRTTTLQIPKAKQLATNWEGTRGIVTHMQKTVASSLVQFFAFQKQNAL